MKSILKFSLITFLFVVNNCTAQTLRISKDKLFKTFQKTILKTKGGGIEIGRSAWFVCNDDSAYYKLDTISLFYSPTRKNFLNCCSSIGLTFFEKYKLIETRFQNCKEPTTASAAKETDFYKVKFTATIDSEILTLINNQGKGYTFKIIELIESAVENSKEVSYELFLKRLNL